MRRKPELTELVLTCKAHSLFVFDLKPVYVHPVRSFSPRKRYLQLLAWRPLRHDGKLRSGRKLRNRFRCGSSLHAVWCRSRFERKRDCPHRSVRIFLSVTDIKPPDDKPVGIDLHQSDIIRRLASRSASNRMAAPR